LQSADEDHVDDGRLKVRQILLGGEKWLPSQVSRWWRKYPSIQWIHVYGITETTVFTSCRKINPDDMGLTRSIIGVAIPTDRVYILDKGLKLCGIGMAGEICIGGAGVGRGYLGHEALTKERFVEDPFRKGGRLYRSGDLGRWTSEGELEYLGRADSQVKIRGFRIETGEIQKHVMSYEGLALC
jgi:non-ribosomal peptide synthetase component F